MFNIEALCQYIIAHENNQGRVITHLKLQKLLYFVQAQCLAQLGTPCFQEEIEAWQYGPVVPSVYHKYKGYGSIGIGNTTPSPPHPPQSMKSVIDAMLETCGPYTAEELVNITHDQSPWINAWRQYNGCIITKESIRSYFINS